MKAKWTSDKCYGEWGVDGSECSIVKYLSEVERFCPKLPSSNQKTPSIVKNTTVKVSNYLPLCLCGLGLQFASAALFQLFLVHCFCRNFLWEEIGEHLFAHF